MLRYATSCIIMICSLCSFAQVKPLVAAPNSNVVDTVTYKSAYGLRAGIDLASLVRTALDDDYTGFQVMADYRWSDNWYAAGEIGTESIEEMTNQIDYETSGSFVKLGADYNFYGNWLDLDNMIYVGFRAGGSTFDQTLNRFEFYQDSETFETPGITETREFDGLTAFWAEVQAGVKVQVLNNVYLSLNVQLKRLVNEQIPDNFDNLYVPGFGRTYDTNQIGVGYSYGITYRIPFYKR